MKTIWATSIWLYLGDVCFVGLLIWGTSWAAIRAAQRTSRMLRLNLSYTQLKHFMTFQVIWLLTGLIAFKFIILQGGPGFTHTVGTGANGSVQFSTAGETAAAALTAIGLWRWALFLYRAAQPTTTTYQGEEYINHGN
jgi:hypothetical protein